MGLHYLIGATCGFVAGLIVTYVLSERFVFSSPKVSSKFGRFALFALIGVIGVCILNSLMWLLTDVAGLYFMVSKAAATVVVYLWNFFARRALYRDDEPISMPTG